MGDLEMERLGLRASSAKLKTAMALGFAATRGRESEARRVSERKSMGMTRWLCSLPWPDWWGQHWRMAIKWCT